MTRDEAIKLLQGMVAGADWLSPYEEALDMAIEALEGVCFDEWCDDNEYTVITISGDENDNWYVVREPFVKIIDTIQAASVEQYDKLSQTVVIKNK